MDDVTQKKTIAWYYNAWFIAFAILMFGPLGLFPLWYRPKTSIIIKIVITVLVFAITVWLMITTAKLFREVIAYYQEMAEAINNS